MSKSPVRVRYLAAGLQDDHDCSRQGSCSQAASASAIRSVVLLPYRPPSTTWRSRFPLSFHHSRRAAADVSRALRRAVRALRGQLYDAARRVNGNVVQPSDTSMLTFSIPRLIEYTSTIFDLVPGDVIATDKHIAVLRNPVVDE